MTDELAKWEVAILTNKVGRGRVSKQVRISCAVAEQG